MSQKKQALRYPPSPLDYDIWKLYYIEYLRVRLDDANRGARVVRDYVVPEVQADGP